MSSKRWCFTLNNYSEDDVKTIDAWVCKYKIYGKESGASGTPHLQGFIIFNKLYRLSGVRKLLPTAHWEVAKGNSQQASNYCKKEGDYSEQGILSCQGKRNDLSAAVNTLKESGLRAVGELHPEQYVKYGRGFRDLNLVLQESFQHTSTRGLWIWGSPGTGKSHAARSIDECAYFKAQNKWWDGYDGEETVILDDLDSPVLSHHLKIWSDKYSCTGETKGGTVQLQHKLFIVTSNFSIERLFSDDIVLIAALYRRFQVIEKTSKNQIINYLSPI